MPSGCYLDVYSPHLRRRRRIHSSARGCLSSPPCQFEHKCSLPAHRVYSSAIAHPTSSPYSSECNRSPNAFSMTIGAQMLVSRLLLHSFECEAQALAPLLSSTIAHSSSPLCSFTCGRSSPTHAVSIQAQFSSSPSCFLTMNSCRRPSPCLFECVRSSLAPTMTIRAFTLISRLVSRSSRPEPNACAAPYCLR